MASGRAAGDEEPVRLALKRMLAKARLIIISELQFSLDISEEEAVKKLERALPKVEEMAEA